MCVGPEKEKLRVQEDSHTSSGRSGHFVQRAPLAQCHWSCGKPPFFFLWRRQSESTLSRPPPLCSARGAARGGPSCRGGVLRLPRGRRLDRSALGTLRCRFFLGGGTTCTSASPRSSRRSCAVPLVRGLARDGPVGDVWAAPPVCPAAPRHGVEQRPLEPDPRGGVRPAEPRRRASHEPWRVHRPAAAAR